MPTITIPKNFIGSEKLVAIPDTEYKRLLTHVKKTPRADRQKSKEMTAEDLLRLSREARKLYQEGKLPLFSDLIKKEYPALAKKHEV